MVLTLGIEYFANIRPAKHWEDAYPVILAQLAAPLLEFLKSNCQVVPRLNILVPRRTYRWLWIRRYFVIWWSAGMENQPDVNIVFSITSTTLSESVNLR
jgi:hypothetical protein